MIITEIMCQRQAVVDEAMTWLKTPFHHRAAVKKAGVDCACLIAEAFNFVLDRRELDPEEVCPSCGSLRRYLREFESATKVFCQNKNWHSLLSVPPYYDQWHLHQGRELYLDDLKEQGFVEVPVEE